MRLFRFWLAARFIAAARRVYPGDRKAGVWQIIEVPRRISLTEAEHLASQVVNL